MNRILLCDQARSIKEVHSCIVLPRCDHTHEALRRHALKNTFICRRTLRGLRLEHYCVISLELQRRGIKRTRGQRLQSIEVQKYNT